MFTVFCRGDFGQIAVQRSLSGSHDRSLVDGQSVSNSSDLASTLPCLVLNAQSFKLIEGAPDDRRRYFDWGVFHVEHRYAKLMAGYRRALKQRNHLIKTSRQAVGTDSELSIRQVMIGYGEEISALREAVANRLNDALKPYIEDAVANAVLPAISVGFKRGYSEKHPTLREALSAAEARDSVLGQTTVGPHKYDLNIILTETGAPARDHLSRGQIKRLVMIMKLAQLDLLGASAKEQVVALADDLPAELDANQLSWALHSLQKALRQVFITTVDARNVVEYAVSSNSDYQMFHVEHGRTIREEQR